jgi:hypothetical protein
MQIVLLKLRKRLIFILIKVSAIAKLELFNHIV